MMGLSEDIDERCQAQGLLNDLEDVIPEGTQNWERLHCLKRIFEERMHLSPAQMFQLKRLHQHFCEAA